MGIKRRGGDDNSENYFHRQCSLTPQEQKYKFTLRLKFFFTAEAIIVDAKID